ncbi:MAG: hypothetical protein HOP27_02240 [Anaerolineales bacterium]|nr:hypothetical protein [Anaerolineales bacterium]
MEFINQVIHALTETHPLHPMLVHFPIALTGAGALFILLAAWKNSSALEQAAFANITLAFFGSIAAGLSGMRDNISTYDGLAPNAGTKVILAFVLILITGGTAYARWRNPKLFTTSKGIYIAAYVVSFLIALVLAFLGGVILYGF